MLGGGVSRSGEQLLGPVRERVREQAMGPAGARSRSSMRRSATTSAWSAPRRSSTTARGDRRRCLTRAALAEHTQLRRPRSRSCSRRSRPSRSADRASTSAGGRVYTFGNGGSAADAQHLAGELVGRFKRERRPLPAKSLSADPSAVTCIANDYSFDDVFARQVRGARPRRATSSIGYTTSGRSENVVRGLAAARDARRDDGAVRRRHGGPAAAYADHALVVPSTSTARMQEMHLLLMHLVLDQVDAWAAGE